MQNRCIKDRNRFVLNVLTTLFSFLAVWWIYSITQSDKKDFYQTYQSFQDGSEIICGKQTTMIVSKSKGWNFAKRPNLITNGTIIFHMSVCKKYGE